MTKQEIIKKLESYIDCEWEDGYLNELYTEAKEENNTEVLELLEAYVKTLELDESLEKDDDQLRWVSPGYRWYLEHYDEFED